MLKDLVITLNVLLLAFSQSTWAIKEHTCVVKASPNGTDSAPAIVDAFRRCGHHDGSSRGKVVFENETYTIQTVMNTTGLSNVDIELRGTLLWDNSNITYWLNNSLPVGYQNQSSAWLFGGKSVFWDGYGYGTLNGDGQVCCIAGRINSY